MRNRSGLPSIVLFAPLVLILASVLPVAFAADESRLLSDRGGFSVGGFLVDFDSEVAASGQRIGTGIDLEDDLRIEQDKSTYRIDGFYRFSDKHALDGGYFSMVRDGAAVLDNQIEFDDVLYGPGRIDSGFDVKLFRVAYRYSFVNDGRTEAGFTAGLSAYDFSTSLNGTVIIDEGLPTQREETVGAEAGVLAPVPTFGMFIHHAFIPDLVLRMEANFFRLNSIQDYSGRFLDTRVTLDWYFSRNVGIGGGFNNSSLDFSSDTFRVDYRQNGFLGYMAFVF